ncbi:hypothetical protein P8452_06647 [Trifolium repens]|nr:hypothetical protein P8452_06647 [Trifolium repens]
MIHNQFIFFFLFTFFIASHGAPPPSEASCPMDLSYVETFPWDTSTCRDPIDSEHCCQSLLSLFGIGLAKHLKETSIFQLPNENISTRCLQDFKLNLSSLKIQPSLVPSCFQNSTQFVTNTSSCAGITNMTDWKQKVGMLSPLDTSCNGDLSSETSCNICTEAGFKVTAQLRSAVVGVILAFVLIVMYRKWNKMRRENLYHRSVENSVRDSVLPNTGAKWFHISELEKATNKFSQKNMIGQGGDGVVYKGTLSDGTLVAVKEIFDLDTRGDEEFCYEVEIISKIKHRNLLALRGCCVTSHSVKGKVDEIFDEAVKDEGPEKIMERFVLVGILCAHAMVALRPTIAEALKMLEGDIDIPNLPDRSVPLGHESFQSSLLQGSGRTTPYTSFYSSSNISTISRN